MCQRLVMAGATQELGMYSGIIFVRLRLLYFRGRTRETLSDPPHKASNQILVGNDLLVPFCSLLFTKMMLNEQPPATYAFFDLALLLLLLATCLFFFSFSPLNDQASPLLRQRRGENGEVHLKRREVKSDEDQN